MDEEQRKAMDGLKDLIMLASDPKPGRHLESVLVVSAWVSDDNPRDAICDFLGSPPDDCLKLVWMIQTQLPKVGFFWGGRARVGAGCVSEWCFLQGGYTTWERERRIPMTSKNR